MPHSKYDNVFDGKFGIVKRLSKKISPISQADNKFSYFSLGTYSNVNAFFNLLSLI